MRFSFYPFKFLFYLFKVLLMFFIKLFGIKILFILSSCTSGFPQAIFKINFFGIPSWALARIHVTFNVNSGRVYFTGKERLPTFALSWVCG